ncbi:hypothetical protein BP6252_03013 [Coleophoma cylindrospora]|uniref:RWD domain-containing protein n=1 Tax=Coleophoma cylindrospora TaxID=1849047 RepID=A0A3D8S749_9HELO|nr:hypothetical protein BP6252_03013 [Coleophoma cylindrospora]
MNEDLQNEVEAINSIYGPDSLVAADGEGEQMFVLHLPQQEVSLRLQFPHDYPTAPPAVLGTESAGEHLRKGEAANVLSVFRDALGRLFQPGEVCLFDVVEEVNATLEASAESAFAIQQASAEDELGDAPAQELGEDVSRVAVVLQEEPPWVASDVVIELKSVFIARCAPVSSPNQARQYLQHLLDTDKKVRSATHNITAWRIRGEGGASYQDCDDDGETAAGGRVLHLMQLMDLWDVMVVVTRWYGGHQLGPKRFSIINAVARDAFVKGDFVKDDNATKKKGKR